MTQKLFGFDDMYGNEMDEAYNIKQKVSRLKFKG